MSTYALGAEHGPRRGRVLSRGRSEQVDPLLRAPAFLALAAFASVQYGELLLHPPAGRLLAVAAIASLGCVTLALRGRDGRPLLRWGVLRLLALALTLTLALLALGVPAHLLAPAGWSRLGAHAETGVEGLGAWLWPYRGGARWTRLVVLLVVPVALVLAGALCFWPSPRGERARSALALAILVGLFLAGAANSQQAQPGLRGLLLLAAIGGWIWLPGAGQRNAARAARWLLLPALLALAVRPVLASSGAWLPFREADSADAREASFQWDQQYGPIDWPRTDALMFTLHEPHPRLLRVTSLDRFDGLRFLRSADPPGSIAYDLPARHARAWIAQATVDLVGLRSQLLAGADGLVAGVEWRAHPAMLTRQADGTLSATQTLPRSSYGLILYRPHPTERELRAAPSRFPRAYLPYAQFELPAREASGLAPARFAAEVSAAVPRARLIGPSQPGAPLAPAALARVEASPYGPMLRLARGLAAGARSDYEVARRIDRFLLANYRYDEHVPPARYPLEAFLFEQKRGYCQQFSGAMTLMLRMDGIPARVASGFKPTDYDTTSGVWKVRAIDAHSWVEVFFSGIGWVAFDPTPAAPLGVTGSTAPAKDKSEIVAGSSTHAGGATRPALGVRAARAGGGLGLAAAVALGLAALASLLLGGLWLRAHARLRRALAGDGEGSISELRRALERSGEWAATLTLAQLERGLRAGGEQAAGDYVRSLRERRYGERGERPPRGGRGALRRALLRRAPRRAVLGVLASMPPGAMRRD